METEVIHLRTSFFFNTGRCLKLHISIALAALDLFWYVRFSFYLAQNTLKIPFDISLSTGYLEVFSFQIFRNAPAIFLLLISNLIPLWSENIR